MGNLWEIHRGDADYPAAIEDLGDAAPQTIYGVGDRECLDIPCISIIGARMASPYGTAVAEMAARVSVECDLVVVSGGARGCDYAATRSAIDCGGRAIIVTGGGADVVYPRTSQDIFHDAVRRGGAVISMFDWKTQPRPYMFVKRNALIAALSRSLFVTEAGLKSGTMSTAEVANQLGRNIYAIPGSIFSPSSQGTNALIASGASIIASEMDLQTQIGLDYGSLRLVVENRYDGNSQIISALIASPMRPEELAARLGQPVMTLVTSLADYEGRGLVTHLVDGRYTVTQQAYEKYFRRGAERQGLLSRQAARSAGPQEQSEGVPAPDAPTASAPVEADGGQVPPDEYERSLPLGHASEDEVPLDALDGYDETTDSCAPEA